MSKEMLQATKMRHSWRPLSFACNSLKGPSCLGGPWRAFNGSAQFNVKDQAGPSPPPAAPAPPRTVPAAQTTDTDTLESAPRSYGKAVEEYTPKPLNRPIGLPNPPSPGENTGIDLRTWRQRRADFVDYDKHLAKREQLKQKISTPYFREWSNMRMHKGKSFLAPPRLFKGDKALYFPNLFGETLSRKKEMRDTTIVLEDKVSIVSVFSSVWAQRQAESFTDVKRNPELHQVVDTSGGLAQMISVNIEENSLKAMLIKLFMYNLRRTVAEKDWEKYFIIRKGMTNEIRDAIGLLNSKVGYTYLLDGLCRIRWAGSGICEGDEREGLVRGTRRLIEEARAKPASKSEGSKARGKDVEIGVEGVAGSEKSPAAV